MPKVEVDTGYRDAVIEKEPETIVPVSSTPHTKLGNLIIEGYCPMSAANPQGPAASPQGAMESRRKER